MKHDEPGISPEVLALRSEFDLGFAQTPSVKNTAATNFLGIYLDNNPFAIRANDIAGIYTDRRIMPMPSPVSSLLGVCRFRGLITPVYDLAALLGYPRSTLPRWIMLVRLTKNGESLAIALERFESLFAANSSDLIQAPQLPASTPNDAHMHLYEAVRSGEVTRPVIRLSTLLNTLQQSRSNPS